jgi:hypothetical protein
VLHESRAFLVRHQIEQGRPLGLQYEKIPRLGILLKVNRAGYPKGPQSGSSMLGFRTRPVHYLPRLGWK